MPPRIAVPVPSTIDPEYNRRCYPLYLEALERSGATPVPVPLDLPESELHAVAASCAGVLLPGSLADVEPARYGHPRDPASAPADVARERTDLYLLTDAAISGKPVLAICYGLQLLNVSRGGTLLQDLAPAPVNHSAGPSVAIAHTADVDPQSTLAALLDPAETAPHPQSAASYPRLPINSSHHQAVGIPGQGLRVSARCAQDGVVEALEADPAHPANTPGQFLLAVQWHPERSFSISATSRALFYRLVSEAAFQKAKGAAAAAPPSPGPSLA